MIEAGDKKMTLNVKHPGAVYPIAAIAALLILTALDNAIAMLAFSAIVMAVWSFALCFKQRDSMRLELVATAVGLALVVAIACAMALRVY